MEITEVRVAVRESSSRAGEHRLRAYATVTFDHCFVVRNIKIIDGTHGLFVAMPSRKPKVACAQCAFKNDLGGRYCTQCGAAQPPMSRSEGAGTNTTEVQAHRDIAHPITAVFRQVLQRKILEAYEAERTRERRPETGAVDETV